MNAFTVYKVCQAGSKQLLLVQPFDKYNEISMTVYDEHTGQTLLRLTNCTVAEFKRAIAILEQD